MSEQSKLALALVEHLDDLKRLVALLGLVKEAAANDPDVKAAAPDLGPGLIALHEQTELLLEGIHAEATALHEGLAREAR